MIILKLTSTIRISLFTLAILFFSVCLKPASASTLYPVSERMENGKDTGTIEIRLDPEGRSLNTIEGSIKLDADFSKINKIEIIESNSIIDLWLKKPEISLRDGTIFFIGGSRNGFSNDSLLFKIRPYMNSPSTIVITPLSGSAYLNDGTGNKDSIRLQKEEFQLKNISTVSTEIDTIPPQFVEVEIGEDESIFGGMKFVSVVAKDSGSGVSHFLFKEGDLTERVSTEGIYVLKDQINFDSVSIEVFDKAGNVTVFNLKTPRSGNFLKILIIITIIIVFIVILKYYKSIKRK